MESDRFKWLIVIGIFLIFFSGGYLIFQALKPKPPAWKPSQQVAPPRVSPMPSPAVSGTSSPSVSTLPRTGAPIGLMVIFASSALVSGYFLRKFPK